MIDVGAHEGEFLSYNLKNKKIKTFFAFEPKIEIFNILKKNIGKNKKVKFVRIPKFEEVPYPVVMEPNLVVEYYSR